MSKTCGMCKFKHYCREAGYVMEYCGMDGKEYIKSLDPTCPKEDFSFERGVEVGIWMGKLAAKRAVTTALSENVFKMIDDVEVM